MRLSDWLTQTRTPSAEGRRPQYRHPPGSPQAAQLRLLRTTRRMHSRPQTDSKGGASRLKTSAVGVMTSAAVHHRCDHAHKRWSFLTNRCAAPVRRSRKPEPNTSSQTANRRANPHCSNSPELISTTGPHDRVHCIRHERASTCQPHGCRPAMFVSCLVWCASCCDAVVLLPGGIAVLTGSSPAGATAGGHL